MNILYLHQHFVARSGTSGGRSHEFSRLWVQRGHKVTLVTGRYEHSGLQWPPGKRRARFNVDGIDVRGVGVPYSQTMSPALRMRAFAAFMVGACWEAMRAPRPAVVFATSTPLTVAIPAIWAAAWHRCPFVFEVRDLWPAAPIELGVLRNPVLIALARGLERLAYRRASHIVALSPGMKEGIVATGVPPAKVSVIPNASDVELFRVPPEVGQTYRASQGELEGRPWVVYAGAFGRVNQVTWAVNLAAATRQLAPEIAFVLCGEGGEKRHCEVLASQKALHGSSVFFSGALPRTELPKLLSAATMLSSWVRNLPVMQTNSANKFFDAFAAGKPVVINYGGWQAELLERTGAGLVLDQTDVEGSARRLVAAIRDPLWLQRAAEASARLGEQFDRRKLAAELLGVLKRVAAKGRIADEVDSRG